MATNIENKMMKLSDKMQGGREDHIQEVQKMQKVLKNAMLKKNLKEHPALSQLLSLLRKREEGYAILLGNKEDLTEDQRKGYFERRKEIRFILSFFENADRTIENMEKRIDYQLSDEIEEDVDNG